MKIRSIVEVSLLAIFMLGGGIAANVAFDKKIRASYMGVDELQKEVVELRKEVDALNKKVGASKSAPNYGERIEKLERRVDFLWKTNKW